MGKLVKAAVALVAALVLAGAAEAATYRGVEPVTVSGYPRCNDLSGLTFTTEVKFSPLEHGASADGIFVFYEQNVLGWYTLGGTILVKAVIIKGGPYSNVYRYPAFDDYSDDGLLSPVNPKNGKRYGFTEATFCY